MSIQSIQVFKQQEAIISKKGKKFVVIGFEDVKQFWFQEDIWEHIKSYFIPRSRWFYAMRNTRHNDLRTILHGLSLSGKYMEESQKLYKRARAKTEDFKTMKKLKNQIVKSIHERPDYQNLFKDGVQIRQTYEYHLTDFKVNEVVLFYTNYQINGRIRVSGNRKGVIRKINKKTFKIELYNFETTKTEGELISGDNVRWLDTFDTTIVVDETATIHLKRKGFLYGGYMYIPHTYDNEFEIGVIDDVITNNSLL